MMTQKKKFQLVLASKSIDRGNILHLAKIPNFDILITSLDETPYKEKFSDPIELVGALSKAKAENAKKRLMDEKKEAIIIAADTVVVFEDQIIGKAKDEEDAFKILKKLSGNKHKLITGIAVTETNNDKQFFSYNTTIVKFLKLTDEEIRGYIHSGEWKGRAGAYSIREKAGLFIESIEGSPSNVMGLQMHKLFQILKNEFNINLLLI